MTTLPFKLSKLAAGIGSVRWWMAYAPQLQAQPLQITVPIPLATTWPESVVAMMERMHRVWPLGTRVVVTMPDSERGPGFSARGRVFKHDRSWGGRELTVDFDEKQTLDGWERWGHTIPIEFVAFDHRPPCDCAPCLAKQRAAFEESMREFDAQVAACKAAGCANGPDGPGPHYCAAPSEAGSDDVFALNLPHGRASYIEGPDAWPERPHPAGRPAKPKRVRVRVKPLTAADIAVGAWYVPKRGNDKTPNLFVAAIDDAGVLYDRRRPDALSVGEVTRVSMADFLALVARRADT